MPDNKECVRDVAGNCKHVEFDNTFDGDIKYRSAKIPPGTHYVFGAPIVNNATETRGFTPEDLQCSDNFKGGL